MVGNALSGATWAPAYISYGDNNRSSMVRCPGGRIELRLPDGGCNPYWTTAAVIAAGLDGVDRELEPGEPQNINHYAKSRDELEALGVDVLPQSLAEAVDELEKDSLFADQLGKEIVGEFTTLKRMEWVEYQRQVSNWELERYAEFF